MAGNNRVFVQEGYSLPFSSLDGYRRKKSRSRRGGKQQSKMKSCAVKWKRSGKRGKYVSFMKNCLKK